MRARPLQRVLALAGVSLLTALAGVAGAAPDISTGGDSGVLARAPLEDRVGGGAWSPDGRTVTFARFLKQRTLLMVVDVASGRSRTLAKLPGQDLRMLLVRTPSFSPDGMRIGIILGDKLYVVGTDGRVLLNGYSNVSSFTFAPNGREVALTTYEYDEFSKRRLIRVDLESRRTRQLAKAHFGAEWAPGGDWIAFARSQPGLGADCEFYVIRPSGHDEHQLPVRRAFTGRHFTCDHEGWSPDNTRFAFWVYDGGNYTIEIYAFRRAGGLGRVLRQLPVTEYVDAGWTRSGRFVMIAGPPLRRILERHATDERTGGAVMSPDGHRVVFPSGWACKNVRLWIGSVATGRVKRLTRGC